MPPKDFLVDTPWLYQAQITFVDWLGYIAYTVITLYVIGILFDNTHLEALYTTYMSVNFFVKMLLGSYLVYRFHTFRQKVVVTELDRKVIYSASLYIVIISLLDLYQPQVNKLLDKVKQEAIPTTEASNATTTAAATTSATATTATTFKK